MDIDWIEQTREYLNWKLEIIKDLCDGKFLSLIAATIIQDH